MKTNFLHKIVCLLLVGVMLSWTGCVKYDDDIAALNDRIDSLESVTIADLESQVATLESSIAAAQQLIADNQAELESLIEDMEAEIVELQAQLDAAEDDLAALEERVADLESQVEQLEKDVAAAQAAADAAQAAADDAQDAADAAQDAADAAQATANKATTDAAAAQAAADAAQKDADAAQDAADAAQTAADVAQAEVDALEIELATLKTEIAATYATIATVEALEVRIAQLESDIDAVETSIANLEDMDKELKALIDANSALIADNAEDIATNAAAIAALESDLTDLATKLADEIARLEGLIDDLEERADGFDESIEDINEALTELNDVTIPGIQDNIATLQSDLDTLEGEVGELEGKVGANTDDIAALKERMDTAEGKIEAAEGRLDDIEAELLLVWAEFETIREEFAAADQALYEKLSGEFATAIANLRTELEGWVGDQLATYWSTYFSTTGADAEAFVAAMKELLTSAACDDWFVNQSELSDLDAIVATLRYEFDALESEYDAYVAANDLAIQALKDEISEINDLIAGLRSDVTVLQSEVASLLAQIQSISYVPTSISFLETVATYNFVYADAEGNPAYFPLTQDNVYTISYDIRPATAAAAVIAGFEAIPEDFYMMFENVTRSAEAVDVVGVSEGSKDGRINVSFSVDFDEELLSDKALAVAFGIYIDGLTVETEEGETEDQDIYVDIMSDYAALADVEDDRKCNLIYLKVDTSLETVEESQEIPFDFEGEKKMFDCYSYSYYFKGADYTAAELEALINVDLTTMDATMKLTADEEEVVYYDRYGVAFEDPSDSNIVVDAGGNPIVASLDEPSRTGCAYQSARATASYKFVYNGTSYETAPVYSSVIITPEQTIWSATASTVWSSDITYYRTETVLNDSASHPGNDNKPGGDSGNQGGGSSEPSYTTKEIYEMWISLSDYEITYGNTTVSIADVLTGISDAETILFAVTTDFDGISYIESNNAHFNATSQELYLRLTDAAAFQTIFGNGDGNGNTVTMKLVTNLYDGDLPVHEYVINLTASFDAYLASMSTEDSVTYEYDPASPDATMTAEVETTYADAYAKYFVGTDEFMTLVGGTVTSTSAIYDHNPTSSVTSSITGYPVDGTATAIALPATADCDYDVALAKSDFVNSAQTYTYNHSVTFIEDENMPYSVTVSATVSANVDFTKAFNGVVRNTEYFGYPYEGFSTPADQIGLMGQYINASGTYIADSTVEGGVSASSFGFNSIALNSIFKGTYVDDLGATVEYPVNTADFVWNFSYTNDPDNYNFSWIDATTNEFTFISPETYTTMKAVSASYQGVELDGVFDEFFSGSNVFTMIVGDEDRPISYNSEVLTVPTTKEVEYGEIDTYVFNISEEISLLDRLGVDIFSSDYANNGYWATNPYYTVNSEGTYTATVTSNGVSIAPSLYFGDPEKDKIVVTYANDTMSSVDVENGDYANIVSFDYGTGTVTVTNTSKKLNADFKVTIPVYIRNPWYYAASSYVFYIRGNGSVE